MRSKARLSLHGWQHPRQMVGEAGTGFLCLRVVRCGFDEVWSTVGGREGRLLRHSYDLHNVPCSLRRHVRSASEGAG